jgi:O-antigen/teichoic acid export membrane protein
LNIKYNLALIFSGRILTAIISIVSLRVITTLLKPEEYGVYTLLIAFQTFCGLFFINPIGQHINRHTHAWWDDGTLIERLRKYNKYIIFISIFVNFIVIIWWLTYPATNNTFSSAVIAAVSVSVMVYFGTWNGTLVYVLNMLDIRMHSVFWMTTSSVFGLLFSTILTYEFHNGMAWIFGQSIGMIVGAIGAGLALRRYPMPSGPKFYGGNNSQSILVDKNIILYYCLPLAIATGFMWLQNAGYRFFVANVWGIEQLGMLAVGLSISAQIWSMIESLAMQFLTPYFFRQISNIDNIKCKIETLSDLVNVMWPVYAIVAGFNFIFSSIVVTLLTNQRYHASAKFLVVGVAIELMRCTTNLWAYASQIEKRTTTVILPYGVGAFVILLGIIVTYRIGGNMEIISYMLAISSFTTCVLMVYIMNKIIKVEIDIMRWIFSGIFMIICYIASVLYPLSIDGMIEKTIIMSVGAILCAALIASILWKNVALKRLLSAVPR